MNRNIVRLLICLYLLILVDVSVPYSVHAMGNDHHASDKHETIRGKYKKGELMVKFETGTSDEAKAAVHKRLGSTVIKTLKSIGVDRIKLREGLSVEEAIRLYTDNPLVEYAEPNYEVRIQGGNE